MCEHFFVGSMGRSLPCSTASSVDARATVQPSVVLVAGVLRANHVREQSIKRRQSPPPAAAAHPEEIQSKSQ